MKKILTAFIASGIALSASAVIEGDGYYRVQNAKTGRYIYVLDNTGELNFQATTAELGALELWLGYEKTTSDPATIIYVKDLDGKQRDFDLQTQGTGVKSIINYSVSIRMVDSAVGSYNVFGRNSGLTRYIGDATKSESERGYLRSYAGNDEYFRWLFHPITTDDSNYFGILPEFQAGDDYYASLYADFPFTFHSEGMTAYYVCSTSDAAKGVVYVAPIEGTVPRATPVIIKCSSAAANGNKLNIGGEGKSITDNKLKGVYFQNTSLLHKNLTPNDPATMRVLGRLSDGSVGFVKYTETNLPRNKAYLTVPAGTPDELRIEFVSAGIDDITSDAAAAKINVNGLSVSVEGIANESVEVYSVTGQLVVRGMADGSALLLPAPGLYIVKTPTTVAKILAR
ncbi:MAG: hypothetical protein NC411_02335 [Bacteroides sp.]|nr:hypothetical protein [Bacteroides sp.]